MTKYSIWPKSKFKIIEYLKFKPYSLTSRKLEFRLEKMFPSGYPVLCTSGRAAINIALAYKNHFRPDFVGVNSYTSHCVLDAISRIATPIIWNCQPNEKTKTRLIYHQWGYVQKELIDVETIDDCVDSLCELGTELFPTSQNFEIWSLPKIIGTTSGAVLWCKDPNIAIKIRHLRNKRGGGIFVWILRMMAFINKNFYWLWQGIESQKGKLSRIELFEINNAIDEWDEIVNDRKNKLDLLWEFAPKWIDKPLKRLPCVVPLEFNKFKNNEELNKFKIEVKHFEKRTKNKEINLIKVLPLPIHQDIPLISLNKIKNALLSLNN